MMINAAGRQKASSAHTSVSTESTEKAYEWLQIQLQGCFGVMPCIVPNSSGLVLYGAPDEMGMEMAKRAVDEFRARNARLPLHMVRPVKRLTNLMSIDLSVGWHVQARQVAKEKSETGLITRNQLKPRMVIHDMVHNIFDSQSET
jgi:hypothetical protein